MRFGVKPGGQQAERKFKVEVNSESFPTFSVWPGSPIW
jgi:hypothetical protein